MHTGFLGTAPDGSTTHSFHAEPPGWCCANHILGLPLETVRIGAAAHEAGHLVADLVVGIHVTDVKITPLVVDLVCGQAFGASGVTQIGRLNVGRNDYLTMLAAGEQAEQRWLQEAGLWTPARSWAVERGALDDVAKAIEKLREQHPGLVDDGYRQLFWRYRDHAAALLDAHWNRVLNVAERLAVSGYLTGDEAALYANLPNPPEPGPASG